MKILKFTGTAALCAVASFALAQQPTRLGGTVNRLDGNMLTITAGEAGPVTIKLDEPLEVFSVRRGSLADIKINAFIGVGAMPQADGSQKAMQVTIFAESMRGIGEGHFPWTQPGSTMTNGAVDTSVAGVDGQVLTVKYKGGEKKIIIDPDTVIRAYEPADRADLKPQALVRAFAAKGPDGSFNTSRIYVGRDGVAP